MNVNIVNSTFLDQIFPTYTASEQDKVQGDIQALVEEYLNTTLFSAEYLDEVLDGSTYMLFRHMPIISISKLEYKASDEWATLVEGTDYFVYSDRVVLPNIVAGRQNIRVSYTAGMPVYPKLINMVAEELAAFLAFKRSEGSLLFYKTQTFEERTYEVSNTSIPTILKKLSRLVVRSLKDNNRQNGTVRIGVI
jgi:hypothetical protein